MFTQINDRSNNLSPNRLGLLLKAAKYMDTSINTPLKKRGLLTSYPPPAPTKQRSVQSAKVSYTATGPPKKRFKIDTTTVCKPSINITDKHEIKLRLINKFSKCPVGSSHRVWECTDEIAMAATSSRRFQSLAIIQDTNVKKQDNKESFILHDKDDDEYINPVHSIIRRDIWEGFVVDSFKDAAAAVSSKDTQLSMKTDVTTNIGRVSRYNDTIGFRCRFCKHVPLNQRAPRSAVYPRSLEGIYNSNLRFQRDHIEQCIFIPDEIKEECSRIKSSSKGIVTGRKQYWVESAAKKGLYNGEKGIMFVSDV